MNGPVLAAGAELVSAETLDAAQQRAEEHAKRIAERRRAAHAELAELLRPFHDVLPGILEELGLPADEQALRERHLAAAGPLGHGAWAQYLPAMLRALAVSGVDPAAVDAALAGHAEQPRNADSPGRG
ncbi:MAG TPA: hypothetical protein VN635_09200 [Conexibacter sp.]|nr:hypothetical protein [Conexibacter sp.]